MCSECKHWKNEKSHIGWCPFVLGGGGHTLANEGKNCSNKKGKKSV